MAGAFTAGAIVAGLLVLFGIFKLMWRVAEPNEALIISGLREHNPSDDVAASLGFKIVTGKGTLVIPGVQTVRRLSLSRWATTSRRSPTPPADSSTSKARWTPASTTSSPATFGPSSAA
jgi:hypothetical protein